MSKLDKLDISNFLPHREPFLLVDKILSIDDEHVSTTFLIQSDNIFVADDAIFSETGLVEHAAQTCSTIMGKGFFDEDDITGESTNLIGFISTIKKATVIACPSVGQTIKTVAKLRSRSDNEEYSICNLVCTTYQDEKELLSCEMNLFFYEIK